MNESRSNSNPTPAAIRARLRKAESLVASARRADALTILRDLLTIESGGAFWGDLARRLWSLGDLQSAERAARNFLSSCGDEPQAALMLSMILGDLDKLGEAIAVVSQLVHDVPEHPSAQYGLGLLLTRDNQIEDGVTRFRQAVRLKPDHVEAIEYIAYLDTGAPSEEDFAIVDRAMTMTGSNRRAQGALSYARAKLLERSNDLRGALQAYENGARLIAAEISPDLEAMTRYIGRLKRTFSQQFFVESMPHRYLNSLPIFIVGVPRSGTTLVETILAAHSLVTGAGESNLVRLATIEYGSFEPVDMRRIDAAILRGEQPWRNMGCRLEAAYADRFGSGNRIVEKNLGHHFFLGALAMIAAGAPIIYCRRDPAATAWSCFTTRFSRGNAWSYDFDSIARYLDLYDALMQHWRDVLPDSRIFECRYENLVEHPEETIPRLLAHAGLEPESSCLQPHEVDMPIRTASLGQVRKPIHTNAVSGWRRYEPWLAGRHSLFRNSGGIDTGGQGS